MEFSGTYTKCEFVVKELVDKLNAMEAEEDPESRAERIKAAIAQQLSSFLVKEDKQPDCVKVLVRYPGASATIELDVRV